MFFEERGGHCSAADWEFGIRDLGFGRKVSASSDGLTRRKLVGIHYHMTRCLISEKPAFVDR
jgi:hypothetical protein